MAEVLVRGEGLEVHELQGGYVIYQGAQDRVHYLNRTAAVIFELCDGISDADGIVARFGQLFEPEGSTDNGVRGCLDPLLKEGLVRLISK